MEDNDNDRSFTSSIIKTSTCLLCGDNASLLLDNLGNRLRIKEEDDDNPPLELNEAPQERLNYKWELNLFHFFSRFLHLPQTDWKLGENPVPICEACKGQVLPLKALNDEMKRLKEEIRVTSEKIKNPMDVLDPNKVKRTKRIMKVKGVEVTPAAKANEGTNLDIPKRKRPNNLPKRTKREDSKPADFIPDLQDHNETYGDDGGGSLDGNGTCFSPQAPSPVSDNQFDKIDNVPVASNSIDIVGEPIEHEDLDLDGPSSSKRVRRSTKKQTVVYKQSSEDESDESDEMKKDSDDSDYDASRDLMRAPQNSKRAPRRKVWNKNFSPTLEENGQYRFITTYFNRINETEFQCTTCLETIWTGGPKVGGPRRFTGLKNHAVNEHLTRVCPWPYCNLTLDNKESAEFHYLTQHDKVWSLKNACEICGKPGGIRRNQTQHWVTHLNAEEKKEAEAKGQIWGKSTSECRGCGEEFPKGKAFQQHKDVCPELNPKGPKDKDTTTPKAEEPPQLCIHCGKCFKSEEGLKHHLKRVHPDTNEWGALRFACVQCDRRFAREKQLNAHKLTHKEYFCPICNKKLVAKQYYNRHMKKVHNDRSCKGYQYKAHVSLS